MISLEGIRRYKNKILSFNIVKPSKKINFGDYKTNNIFKKKIKNSKFYFEYGSGATTIYAKLKKKKFISIEADFSFFNIMNKLINSKSIIFRNIGPVGEYSYPIFIITSKILKYITSIDPLFKKKLYPDLVLIDGRFRVACCLNLFKIISKKRVKTEIIIDDYFERKHYNVLEQYFEIKKIGRMASLKIKKTKLDEKIFKLYLLDPR